MATHIIKFICSVGSILWIHRSLWRFVDTSVSFLELEYVYICSKCHRIEYISRPLFVVFEQKIGTNDKIKKNDAHS